MKSIRLVVLGDAGVGKTAICSVYTKGIITSDVFDIDNKLSFEPLPFQRREEIRSSRKDRGPAVIAFQQ